MSGFADWLSKEIGNYGKNLETVWSLGGNARNSVSNFFRDEITNKADLRGAQLDSFLGGVPLVGNFIRGIEGVNQLEDLYNRTGKVPAYPSQGPGAGALAHGVADITRKIEGGSHDLAEFYSGDRDINNVFDSVNGYKGPHVVHEPHKTEYMNYGGL